MAPDPTFARLVSLACHDLRTPLATVNGFARTLERLGSLEEPESRYVAMITAGSAQLAELLEALALVAHVEEGRYDPGLVEVDSLALAQGAAERHGAERVGVSGEGAPVLVDDGPARQAVADLALCALRHGGIEHVDLRVAGPVIELSPVLPRAAPVLLGESLKDFGAAVAGVALRAMGGTVELDGELLRIELPQQP